MSDFTGTWKLESSENFDEFLKELGVCLPMRTLAKSAKPTLTVTVNGSHYIFKNETSMMTTVVEFDLDVEFDEKLHDGSHCKSIVKKVGEKLIQDQKGKHNTTIERWLEDNQLIVTCESNGVKAIRKFKRTP